MISGFSCSSIYESGTIDNTLLDINCDSSYVLLKYTIDITTEETCVILITSKGVCDGKGTDIHSLNSERV